MVALLGSKSWTDRQTNGYKSKGVRKKFTGGKSSSLSILLESRFFSRPKLGLKSIKRKRTHTSLIEFQVNVVHKKNSSKMLGLLCSFNF